MSADPELTRIVRSWLEEGATALPDRVLDAVLDQVPATRQRRAWWPARRLPHMNTSIRIAMAAAAVVVLAVVGFNLAPKAGGVGGSPPTAVPSASASPAPSPGDLPGSQPVAPGTYRSDFIIFTVPAGWDAFNAWGLLKNGAQPPNGMSMNPWQHITTVYKDPCHWQTTGASVGPTVDDLVTALLAQQPNSNVTPTNVTIDGFSGKEIDLMVPLDVNIDRCDGGYYKLWTDASGGDRYDQAPAQHDLLDILDVDGQTRVIHRTYYPANTATDLAELQAIVDSITITP